MGLFDVPNDVEQEKPSDSLGKRTLNSDVYDGKIKLAYLDQSKGGANSVNLIVTIDGKDIRFTEYVTSGKEKGQKTYYEKDGKKMMLPGFNKMNELMVRSVGKGLNDQEVENKTIKVWDPTAGAEVNQQKPILMDLIAKPVKLGILEIKEDKYSDPTQKVFKNEIAKVFDPESGLTSAEIEAGKTEAAFLEQWREKWKDEVLDKSTATTASAGAPASSGTAAPSLFDD